MLKVELEGLEKAMAMFDSSVVQSAARQAINDSIRGVRTATSRRLRNRWNIKKRDMEKKMGLVRLASINELEAELMVKGRPINLTYFGAKHYHQRAVTSRTISKLLKRKSSRSGVIVKIERGKTTHLENSFIAVMKNGHIGVFSRKTKKRLPIRNRATITPASMFADPEIQAMAMETVGDIFPKRFDHHIRRRLRRI